MLPQFTSEYKDKPTWHLRKYALFSRPVRLRHLLLLVITLYCVWKLVLRSQLASLPETINFQSHSVLDDNDLYVSKSIYPESFAESIQAARLVARVHPILDVFFVIDGLTSSDTNLIALACNMAKSKSGATVHLAILGSGHVSIEEFRARNDFLNDCPVAFHDARAPDQILGAHRTIEINSYAAYAIAEIVKIPPKAIIYTHSMTARKPSYFLASLARHRHQATQICLDSSEVETLGWIASMDPHALGAWSIPRIDIVVDVSIHPGALNRLVRSIVSARYFVASHPNIVFVFDGDSARSTDSIIAKMQQSWPADKILVRKKTESSRSTLLESWYPAYDDNYLLIVDEQHELSPFYFHYLHFMLLTYKYSPAGRMKSWLDKQYGITLMSLLDEDSGLPSLSDFSQVAHETLSHSRTPVLWSKAEINGPLLLFPDAFRTLHDQFLREDDALEVKSLLVKSMERLVRSNALVLLYPPAFPSEGGYQVLAKRYIHDIDISDWNPSSLVEAESDTKSGGNLLHDPKWWNMLGTNTDNKAWDVLPQWSDLDLYNEQGQRTPMHRFFKGIYISA